MGGLGGGEQEAAEDFVGGHAAAVGEAEEVGGYFEEAGFADFVEGGKSLAEHRFSEVGAELVEVDAGVEAEAEEEGFFKGGFGGDVIDLWSGGWAVEELQR